MGAVAVGTNPQWYFRFAAVFNSDSFLALLKQLFRQCRGRRIHLVADNATYHKAREVMQWVEKTLAKIELPFLPTYSPKLKAAEYVWKETRRRAAHSRFFPTVDHLQRKTVQKVQPLSGEPSVVEKCVGLLRLAAILNACHYRTVADNSEDATYAAMIEVFSC